MEASLLSLDRGILEERCADRRRLAGDGESGKKIRK